ncbi:ABC transporter ATP-binding protein [Amphibacillus jilinensis]|uniref:ABC transporter ATP-binding protein n=1 Tax=Amphibacillus jilinensis TaxID=1216008 RepID=UPI000312660F|nr:ABC transporter ATP-binding protein [Amphibacillus jilinensis]
MSNLVIKQLSKSFGSKKVLDQISFDVKVGEFVSILGPSGSGKSTLFNLIGGRYLPDQGDILIDNKSIVGKAGQMSYMPQSPSLFPWRTIMKNIVLGAELKGKPDLALAEQMLKKAGLTEVADAYPSALSGGMKQRAAFIRALLSPQDLLCLDEPFSALDEFTRLDMQNWLLSVWETYRKSVLFITHSIEEALYLSDRIVILNTNPARIKAVFEPKFERPRPPELLLTDDFLAWKRRIYQTIKTDD